MGSLAVMLFFGLAFPTPAVPSPCDLTGEAVPQNRRLVRQEDRLYLCEGNVPLAILSGVIQHAVGYLDDDRLLDLAVNWKPRPDAPRRLHVYGLQHGTLPPIWRGSRMSSELVEFTLVPRKDQPDLLVTLEKVGQKRRWVGHRWNNFGFIGICSASVDKDGSGLLRDCGGVDVQCKTTTTGPRCWL